MRSLGSVSIPAWFDWRTGEGLMGEGLALFQSQLGSIGAQCAEWFYLPSCQVSIPAWFDWRRDENAIARALDRGFNPSLVRLAHRHRPCHSSVEERFNPSLVRLAPHRACHGSPVAGPVSIPAWFDWRGLGTG